MREWRVSEERWRLVEKLYHAALERDPAARAAFLADAGGSNDELRREVEALLEYDDQAASFIETPALELAASTEETSLAPFTVVLNWTAEVKR
jgi:hypothetical protein